MTKPVDSHIEKLERLVSQAGGPAEFARKYSQDGADKPIDLTYVSQILNGHRAFGDKSRRNMAGRAGLRPDYFESNSTVEQPPAFYTLWPSIVCQIAEIARELPAALQQQLLGQAKMLRSELRITSPTKKR